MDPISALGAAGSVVGIATFGAQLGKILYQFTNQVIEARDSLHNVLSGIHATSCALESVHGILKEECENLERNGRAIFFSAKAINDVKSTADKCLLIFWKIEATITNKNGSNLEQELVRRLNIFNKQLIRKTDPDPIPVDTALISLSRLGCLRWPLIASKLDSYNASLQSLQLNLVLMFQVISLAAHRMKPPQTQVDYRAFAEGYMRIRRMAARADLAQFSPSLGQQRRQESPLPNSSSQRNQLRLESPAPMANTLRPHQIPWNKRQLTRPLSLSPSRRPRITTPLKPYPNITVEAELERGQYEASQYDNTSMDVRMSTSGSLIDFGGISSEKSPEYFPAQSQTEQRLPPTGTYKSPTIITSHSDDLEEAVLDGLETNSQTENNEDDAPLLEPKNIPSKRTATSGKGSTSTPIMNGVTLSEGVKSKKHLLKHPSRRDPLNPDEGSNFKATTDSGYLSELAAESVHLGEPASGKGTALPGSNDTKAQGSSQKDAYNESTAKQTDRETSSPEFEPFSLTVTEPPLPVNRSSIPVTYAVSTSNHTAPTFTERPSKAEHDDGARPKSSPKSPPPRKLVVDASDHIHTGIDRSQTQSLRSSGNSSYRFKTPNMLSRLKTMITGKQLVTDAYLTAYIIKNGEAYQVQQSGTWRLKRDELRSLKIQTSQHSWHKIFAFLDEFDMAALQEVLSKGGEDGTERKPSIVHLRRFRQSRLKFWTSDEALFAIIRDPSHERSSLATECPRDIDDLRFESLVELTHPSEGPQPIQQTLLTVNHGNEQTPLVVSQSGVQPSVAASSNTVPINPINSTMPQSLKNGVTTVSAPVFQPSGSSQFGGNLAPPPPPPPGMRPPLPAPPPGPPRQHMNSIRIQDITPPKLMDEAACLKKLTSFSVFTIQRCIPHNNEEPTWARAEITEERLSQEAIAAKIKRLEQGPQTVGDRKAALEQYQQGQITCLVDNLVNGERDTAFEWILLQIDTTKAPVRRNKTVKKPILNEVMTLIVYLARQPRRHLNPVVLFQNIEKMKAGPPPPKAVSMSNPIITEPPKPLDPVQIYPITRKAAKSHSKLKRSSTDSESDSFDTDTDSSTTSITSRGAFYRGRRSKGFTRKGTRTHSQRTSGNTRSRSRDRQYSRSRTRESYLSEPDSYNSRFNSIYPDHDPVAAAYEAGKTDAEYERRERERSRYRDIPENAPNSQHPTTADPSLSGTNRFPFQAAADQQHPEGGLYPQTGRSRRPEQFFGRKAGDQFGRALPPPPPADDKSRREPVPYPSYYDSQPYDPQIDDTDAALLDDDGRDIVEQLLLEWTPLEQDDDDPSRPARDESGKPEVSVSRQPFAQEEAKSPPRGRSPSRSSTPEVNIISNNTSRKATVDDASEERDETAQASNPVDRIPPTSEQKGKGRAIDREHVVIQANVSGSRTEESPIPLPRYQSQQQPSWLDPSWAENLFKTTERQETIPSQQGQPLPNEQTRANSMQGLENLQHTNPNISTTRERFSSRDPEYARQATQYWQSHDAQYPQPGPRSSSNPSSVPPPRSDFGLGFASRQYAEPPRNAEFRPDLQSNQYPTILPNTRYTGPGVGTSNPGGYVLSLQDGQQLIDRGQAAYRRNAPYASSQPARSNPSVPLPRRPPGYGGSSRSDW